MPLKWESDDGFSMIFPFSIFKEIVTHINNFRKPKDKIEIVKGSKIGREQMQKKIMISFFHQNRYII